MLCRRILRRVALVRIDGSKERIALRSISSQRASIASYC
jgi:hypothetical protein